MKKAEVSYTAILVTTIVIFFLFFLGSNLIWEKDPMYWANPLNYSNSSGETNVSGIAWTITGDQTGLTGTKSGSYNLNTTGDITMGTNGVSATGRNTLTINTDGYSAPSGVGTEANGDKIVLWDSLVPAVKIAVGVNSYEQWFQSSGSSNSKISFYTKETTATPTERMRINALGNVDFFAGNLTTTGSYNGLGISADSNEINFSIGDGTTDGAQFKIAGTILNKDTPDFHIYGEQNAVINGANDGFEFSIGNGLEGHYGNYMARRNIQILDLALMCKTSLSTGTTINLTINGNPAGCEVVSSGASQVKGSNAHISHSTCQDEVTATYGDVIGFQTQLYDTLTAYCVIDAGVKYLE